MKKTLLSASAALLMGATLMTGCQPKQAEPVLTKSGLDPQQFVDTINGKATALYTLDNGKMEVCITNFGGRIVSIMAPDRNGELRDVVLGFDNIKDYQTIPSDFGAAIGRFANRIDGGKFVLDGETIQLPCNDNGKNCLHGGPTGWQYQVYEAEQTDNTTLVLTMVSPDGDNNFPGEVTAHVTYTLTDENAIVMAYDATTTKPTVINMTNHSYFNLSGDPSKSIEKDSLLIVSKQTTPVNANMIPTGEIRDIEPGTPFDFLTEGFRCIGDDIDADDEQLQFAGGYDHNWILVPQENSLDLPIACVLYCPESGIAVVEKTDMPGIQVYSGNFLNGTVKGKHGITYNKRAGICLETQKYPDGPNKPEWPSTILRPGETYQTVSIFEFHTDAEGLCNAIAQQ